MVPVVVLTGFLGSGKTSLLNGLLELRRGLADQGSDNGKLAILVNELGSVGIDGALLPAGSARQVELPGGCICCSLDENLEQSLSELLDQQPELAMVVIETTGIAEPLPIVWTLAGRPLAGRIRVAAVVTVVDALEHERHRHVAPAVDNQVANADLLVVSKLDCVPGESAAALADLEPALRCANPHAPILAQPSGDLRARALWDLLSDPSLDTATAARAGASDPRPGGSSGHRGGHGEHRHTIDAAVVPISGVLDFEELTSQLEDLPPNYLRIKGICQAIDRATGSDRVGPIAFHRVGARVSHTPLPEIPAQEPCLVALGHDLSADELAACIAASVLGSKT